MLGVVVVDHLILEVRKSTDVLCDGVLGVRFVYKNPLCGRCDRVTTSSMFLCNVGFCNWASTDSAGSLQARIKIIVSIKIPSFAQPE